MSDDWAPDDAFLNADDPAAQAREQRRREREARRQQRQAKQVASAPQPPPAEPEPPSPPPAQETAGGVPPPERRLPGSPARQPFAQRVSAMRNRLAGSRPTRSAPKAAPPKLEPPNPEPPKDGSGRVAGLLAAARPHWKPIALGIVTILLLWFLVALFQPFQGSGGQPVAVTIPKGASVSEVGDLLDREGVISSDLPFISGSTLFQVRVRLAGKGGAIQQGTYTLHKNETYGDAIDQLTSLRHSSPNHSSQNLVSCQSTCTVTIPEGLSRGQVAPYLRKGGLRGSYMQASVRSKYLNPNSYGAQGRARNLEGFLFPDTFDLQRHAPVSDLVQLQLQDFKRRIKGVNMGYARSKNLTIYDVLTIASMIEREVQVPSERKLVAAVIYNRLHRGMPLGIDATTRFAVGNYTSPLTESQLSTPSPYNTRTHPGLPPGPIGNPGLAAIQAAARPAKVSYIYYVVKPGTCGELSFSSTAAQFARDQAAYQRALQAKGSSPTSCPG